MESNIVALPKIKLGKFLKIHYTYASLLISVVQELEKIPCLADLRMNKELTALVCSIIEQVKLKKKASKIQIDKRTFVIEVLKRLYPDTTEEETSRLGDDVDFICANGLHLKKQTIVSCIEGILNFFF